MANFEERTRLYEILTRVNPDGSIASHVSYITEVLRDGAVISATINPPAPVDPSDNVAYVAFVAVMGEAVASALTQAQQLAEEQAKQIAEQAARIAELETQL